MTVSRLSQLGRYPAILTEGAVIERLRRETSLELDGSSVLESAEPEPFADSLMDLHCRYGLKIMGGCCGTDHRHIAAIAKRMSALTGRSSPDSSDPWDPSGP